MVDRDKVWVLATSVTMLEGEPRIRCFEELAEILLAIKPPATELAVAHAVGLSANNTGKELRQKLREIYEEPMLVGCPDSLFPFMVLRKLCPLDFDIPMGGSVQAVLLANSHLFFSY